MNLDTLPGARLLRKVYFRWFGPKRYQYLLDTIREHACRRILEIGVWTGHHAEQMIREAQKKHGAEVEYFGFDLFEQLSDSLYAKEVAKRPPSMAAVKKELEKTGARISLFQGDTNVSLPSAKLPVMDLIFIDGGHSLETVANDWKNVQRVMGPKTVVIFDDYWNRSNEGAKPLVDGLDRKHFAVEVLPMTDTFSKPDGVLTVQFARVMRKQ